MSRYIEEVTEMLEYSQCAKVTAGKHLRLKGLFCLTERGKDSGELLPVIPNASYASGLERSHQGLLVYL